MRTPLRKLSPLSPRLLELAVAAVIDRATFRIAGEGQEGSKSCCRSIESLFRGKELCPLG